MKIRRLEKMLRETAKEIALIALLLGIFSLPFANSDKNNLRNSAYYFGGVAVTAYAGYRLANYYRKK